MSPAATRPPSRATASPRTPPSSGYPPAAPQLALLNDAKLAGSDGHAVIFRQEFGGLPAAEDGIVVVGVVGDKVAYASSSLTGDTALAAQPTLTARQAWTKAAADAGRGVSVLALGKPQQGADWTSFAVDGFAQEQRARLVALPTPLRRRPARLGDARRRRRGRLGNGLQLLRRRGDRRGARPQGHRRAVAPGPPRPSPAPACRRRRAALPTTGPYTVAAGESVGSVVVGVEATLRANDVVLNLVRDGVVVASQDTAPSPEAIHYDPTDAGTGRVPRPRLRLRRRRRLDRSATYTGAIVFSAAGGDLGDAVPAEVEGLPGQSAARR